MAWYYAAFLNKDHQIVLPPTGPLPTYDDAVDIHAKYLADSTLPFPAGWPLHTDQRRVLLDVGSVACADDHDMRRLLARDPVLHAVFKLGYMSGQTQSKEQGTAV